MPALTPITDCDETTYKAIAAVKQGRRRARMASLWPVIEARYQHYIDCTDSLEKLTASPLNTLRGNDCKHCYDKKTMALAAIKKRILEIVPASGLTLCQYCMIGEIDAVDHYAPKDLFPEFSVFPRNLVASCSRCNRMKSARWLDDDVREIASLYFDEIPDGQYLKVDITFPSGDRTKVVFKPVRPRSITRQQFKQIQRQFEILKLIERYNSIGAGYVSESLFSVKALPVSGRPVAIKFLKKMAAQFDAQFGQNYLKAVICRSLASNGDFMDLADE